MSLLYARALAAMGGLRVGDEALLDWCLAVGSWILSVRNGGAKLPFPRPPEALGLSEAVAAGAAAVGVARRPQDHNGIVDDVVDVVRPISDDSADISSGCLLAAFLSSLLDGWDMEGAMAQSLFVAKRGATFGKTKGPSVAGALEAFLDRVYAGGRVLSPGVEAGGGGLRFERHERIPAAIAHAYVLQHAGRAIVEAAPHAEDGPFLASVSGMLCAAYDPQSLPRERAIVAPETHDGLHRTITGLLEIRAARYRRLPRPPAARFRRKKC